MINPFGWFKKFWETFKFILLIYTLIYLPIKVTFLEDGLEDDKRSFAYLTDKFIDSVFLVDLILNFFTPFTDKYDIATKHKTIAIHYLKGWFLLDLISLIPFEEIVTFTVFSGNKDTLASLAKLLKITRLLRLLKLIRLFKSFDFKNSDNYLISYAE